MSWAPANHPQIAVVVYTEHSGEGFVGGAPVAREIYDYYFGLDQAMWQAGQAAQIIPPVIQAYFGRGRHVPSWYGPAPVSALPGRASTGGA